MSPPSAQQIWEAALGELQIQVSKPNYETWLKDTVGLGYHQGLFVVGTPRPFAMSWLESRLHSLIQKTLVGITGQDIEVQFQVCPIQGGSRYPEPSIPVGGFSSTKLNPKYTFSNFAVGDCNHLAYAAAMGISEKPGCSYNPLFIYSKVGLGKTHLLHAIGHVASSHGFRVLCVSTEQFTNEFISAIKERETEKFRNKFRSVDLLLIDDVHFIGGKEQTQESFFHTFNELHNANHQIVITSNCPPRSVPSLEDRLCSRFEGGLTIGIQPPDFNTRLAILQNKVKQHQVNFSEEALKIIAERYHQNVRELEGALNHVIAHIKLTGESLSTRVVQQALLDEYEVMTSPPSPSLIVCTVGEYFHIPPQDLTGRKRTPQISQARQLAIYLIREENHCPLNGIGKIFGGRDHSTILQSYRRIATEINTNCQIRQQVEDIKAILARGGEGMGRGGFL